MSRKHFVRDVKPYVNIRIVAAAVGALLASTHTAAAQSATPRPYRAVFGGAAVDPSVRQAVDISASLSEAYDDNVVADSAGGIRPGALQTSGFYTALSVGSAFQSHGHRFDFQADAGSNFRYYGDFHKVVGTNHFADVAMAARFRRRTTLTMNQSVSTAPPYLYGLFGARTGAGPGEMVTTADDYVMNDRTAFTYGTAVALSHGLTRRGTLSLNSNLRHTDFAVNTPGFRDLTSYEAGGHFGHNLTRDAALRLGYTHKQGELAGGRRQDGNGHAALPASRVRGSTAPTSRSTTRLIST